MRSTATMDDGKSADARPQVVSPRPEQVPRRPASCLYHGVVRHRRRRPVVHSFSNRLFLMSIDLEDVDRVFCVPFLWSTRRFSLVRFCRSDYLGDPNRSLANCVRETVQLRIGRSVSGPVRLLTQVRFLGLVFNPISLYYCYDATGRELEAIVAEVTNTPWGESHCYVIDCANAGRVIRSECPKELHVSPFMEMAMTYRWRLTAPSERLSVHLENHDSRGPVLDATMLLRRRKLTSMSLVATLARFPFMSAHVLLAIYWQALRLWWKNVPFIPHPRHARTS